MEKNIVKAYSAAHQRLLLLDYDGTLTGLKPTPSEAIPTPALLSTLERLANDARNTVVIISGRDYQTLGEWLGGLPVAFAAEHGLMIKQPDTDWQLTLHIDESWKSDVRRIMQQYADKIEGSLIEEKTYALVWHTRAAHDPQKAQEAENILAAQMQQYAAEHRLRIMHGNKIIEIQPAGYSKGIAARQWLDKGGWDFILAAGDDTTDEDLFEAMPDKAFSIKVGAGDSTARHRLSSPIEMIRLLQSLKT